MITTIGVVVPAANEERYLRQCLVALERSRDHVLHRRQVDVRIVLVLDNCTDRSAAVAADFEAVTVLPVAYERVGSTRRAGCATVLSATTNSNDVLLANTDADSAVPRDWLTTLADLADDGADVILGTVCPETGLPDDMRTAWYARYRDVDGHPHVHGANLAIRASCYLELGGWPELATGEDHRLTELAQATRGVRIVRTARVTVSTSARVVGRAPDGFSSYLRGLLLARR